MVISFYASGQLKSKGSYIESKGMLKGSFKDGKQVGLWVEYYDNGQLYFKGSLKDGARVGPWEYYYRHGSSREYKPGWDD